MIVYFRSYCVRSRNGASKKSEERNNNYWINIWSIRDSILYHTNNNSEFQRNNPKSVYISIRNRLFIICINCLDVSYE